VTQGGKGKLAVLGSCHMFSDQYIDKEENSKILVSQLRLGVKSVFVCFIVIIVVM